MEELQRILRREQIESELFFHPYPGADSLVRSYADGSIPVPLGEFLATFAKGRLCVVDARDLDLTPFRPAPVIAIDNRSPTRPFLEKEANVIFFDALPHPLADPVEVMQNFLVSPELVALKRQFEENREEAEARSLQTVVRLYQKGHPPAIPVAEGGAVAYTGTVKSPEGLGPFLSRFGSDSFAIRIGSTTDDFRFQNGVLSISSLPSPLFYRLLSVSRLALTHFGITLFEAIYLGCPVALLVPEEGELVALSHFFADQASLPVVSTFADFERLLETPPAYSETLCPGGSGYPRLIEWIRTLRG